MHASAVAGASGSAAAVVFLLLLWLLNDILLPFVVGAVVAYFFDPVVVAPAARSACRAPGRRPPSRSLAALIAFGVAMAILPPLFGQVRR